ncbi:hypothetical protein [Winogradskyella sp. PE311]|uniref:TapB family protein n=1 Tax=Winogradskyella sp. PE311 TaxID=3366943 RepID=UPI0039806984
MKTLTSILIFLISLNGGFAQNDCKPYIPTKKGTQWELTNYTGKGKVTGKTSYEVIDKIVEGNSATFTINSKSYDKKDKLVFEGEFTAKCIDGVFDIDMDFKMDGNQLKQYKDMALEVDASKLDLPSLDSATGTKLKDGNLTIKAGTDSPISFNMTIDITEREVENREELTTPAGSFDCVVISQKISTKMVVRIKSASKEWYAENIGLVRSESYNKKGKLIGYTLLTMLQD